MMQQYDKMILAILQGDDYHDAVLAQRARLLCHGAQFERRFPEKAQRHADDRVGERPPGRGAGHPEEARRAHGNAL